MNDAKKILEKYRNYSELYSKGVEAGKSIVANRNAKKLSKIYYTFKSDEDIRRECMPLLLEDSNLEVRLWAAAHCLGLDEYITDALKIINELIKSNNKSLSIEAEMVLSEYKEKGTLTF